ncbi:MAG: DHH family phosphoesterase [Acidobacteriota bacterium]
MLDQITRFINEHRRFAITSHERPDGDSLGSSLGLALALQAMGKRADVFQADPSPQAYSSLPGASEIQLTRRLEAAYDGLFILECSGLSRTGIAGLESYPVINIDHHPKAQLYGDLNWLDISAAAVGEMVFELVRALGIALTPEISTDLYVAILTDTGSFQFSNTTARTFKIAGELVSAGADPGKIAQAVYMNEPHSKVQLLGKILNTIQIHPSRKISWIHLTQQMLSQVGASQNETEGIVNYPLAMEGIEMVAFFREQPDGTYRISLRSKNEHDVGSVAENFGGGGHKNAAGLTVTGNFEEVRDRVVAELQKLLSGSKFRVPSSKSPGGQS